MFSPLQKISSVKTEKSLNVLKTHGQMTHMLIKLFSFPAEWRDHTSLSWECHISRHSFCSWTFYFKSKFTQKYFHVYQTFIFILYQPCISNTQYFLKYQHIAYEGPVRTYKFYSHVRVFSEIHWIIWRPVQGR